MTRHGFGMARDAATSGAFPFLRGTLLCAGLALGAPVAADESAHAEARRALESARYLFDIEGDRTRAMSLLDPLAESGDPAIRALAAHLRGRFLEDQGRHAEAATQYAVAVSGPGLSRTQRARVAERLLVLDPSALRPLRDAGSMAGLPVRIIADGDTYVLVEASTEPGRTTSRLFLQDARGELHLIPAAPAADEELLDAADGRLLTRSAPRQRVYLRRAPDSPPLIVQDRFLAEEGHLLAGEAAEMLLIGAQEVRLVRDGRTIHAHPLPGAGCTWHPTTPRARQGVLFCPGRALFRADFAAPSVTQVPLSGELPAAVQLAGDYLALRHGEHIEIRRAPSFDAFLWGIPAGLQEAFSIGRELAFTTDGEGPVRALSLRTGRVVWRRDLGAETLIAHGDEAFVTTHARTLVALDAAGQILYEYETGWDREPPLMLPARDWLVLHAADGSRVRLDRELLRAAGKDRSYLLHAAREAGGSGDARRALESLDSLLALEPGNGIAWRETARLLDATQAPDHARMRAWLQAARSRHASPWGDDTAFARLAEGLEAAWVWKRRSGPRFFPVLSSGNGHSFYIENDNTTLLVLDNRRGRLAGTRRFTEPLDLKVSLWAGDTIIVSGTNRLHFLAPPWNGDNTWEVRLRNPLCHAIMLPEGLLFSDWNGTLHLLDPATRTIRWQVGLARGGLLLAASGTPGTVDVYEIDGGYQSVRLRDGESLASVRLPPGTVTEVHSGTGLAFAGYNEGLIIAVDKRANSIAWQRDMGEQIFSLSGRGNEALLVGTASQRLVHVEGETGTVRAQTRVPTYLFNRPLLTSDGYWVGTTEPALEKRSLNHSLIRKLPLPGMPGTPAAVGDGIAVSTLDNFIVLFPER